MYRRITALFLIIILFLTQNNIVLGEEKSVSQLNALSALVMEKETKRVLYEKEGYTKRAMASTTKIMTCLIALEEGNLKDEVVISERATKAVPVKMYVKAGETYVLEDLLYALMLQSYNDVAVAIAEHIGGSVEEFCAMMTERAKSLGAMETSFKTPNGLDAEGHYTTAYDLALITAEALDNEKFISITNTRNYQISKGKINSRSHSLVNKNRFLDSYSGANGVKTGFTGKAGLCFVGAAKKDETQIVSVVLASGWPPHKNYRWQDSKKLMDFAFDNYKWEEVLEPNRECKDILIINGKQEFVETYVDGKLNYYTCEADEIAFEYDLVESIEAPVETGQIAGKMNVLVNGEICGKFDIKTKFGVERVDFPYYFQKIFRRWIGVLE